MVFLFHAYRLVFQKNVLPVVPFPPSSTSSSSSAKNDQKKKKKKKRDNQGSNDTSLLPPFSQPTPSRVPSSSPLDLVQYLNQHAVYHMQLGDRKSQTIAITSLTKALNLWDTVDTIGTATASASDVVITTKNGTCPNNTIDECILQSSQQVAASAIQHRRKDMMMTHDNEDKTYFIYSQPIKLPRNQHAIAGHLSKCTDGYSNMMSTILILNLAIALHLEGVALHRKVQQRNEGKRTRIGTRRKDRSKWLQALSRKYLLKSIKMYDVAMKLAEGKSAWVKIIVSNNVGAIHRLLGNHNKYEIRNRQLLSTMMMYTTCVVNNGNNFDHQQQRDTTSSSSSTTASLVDGFIRNISHLILQDHCTGAA